MDTTQSTARERFALIVDTTANLGLKPFGALAVVKQLLLTASWVAGDEGLSDLENALIEASNAVDEQQNE